MIKFKYYKTGATFSAATDIANDDIVFVEDGNKIVTHDHEYVFGNAYNWADYLKKSDTLYSRNGSAKSANSSDSFYAPTESGTSGYILKSGGANATPTWATISSVLGNYVTTFGGKSGAITVNSGSTTAWAVNFTVDSNKKLSGTVVAPTSLPANGGTAENVSGTVAIANGGTGATSASAARTNLGLGSAATYTAASTVADNSNLPTGAAIVSYVSSQVSSALASVLKYKGTIGSSGATVTALPATHKVGDVYVVKTAGTYAGQVCEIGDYIICNTDGSSASDSHWDVISGENQVSNKSANLAAAGSSATIATVDGTDITVTTPSSWKLTDTTYAFDGTYNASSNKAATVSTVTNAIGALDGAITGTAGAGKTLTAFSQTNGKVTATFGNISITKSLISDFPTIPAAAKNGTFSVKTKVGDASAVTAADFTADQNSADDVTFIQGSNVTLTTDTTNRTITIAAKQPTVGNKALNIASGSGTATQAITMNESSADKTLTITGDGTYITGAVSGSAGSPTVTLSHADPGEGSALTTSNGTAANYALNTEYTVLTGVTVTADAKGHITGVSTSRQKIKDTNTDTKVTQAAAITTAGEYPVILGYSTATTSVTNTVNKAAAFTYNPNTSVLSVTKIKGSSSSATAVDDIISGLTWAEYN